MKILIIHNRYSRIGGEEKVVDTQKRLLISAGHDVTTYIRDYHEMDGWKFGKVQSLFSSLYSRKSVSDIRRIIDTFKPDTAIVHNLFPIVSAAVLKELKKANIPTAMTIHNYRLFCPIGLFFTEGHTCTKCAEKSIREFCCLTEKCQGSYAGSLAFSLRGWWSRKMGYFECIDKFLSVSEFQKTRLIQYGIKKEKIDIIPNCVSEGKISEKDDYIAFVGRLSPEKGIDLLFDIAARLPKVKFMVAGQKSPDYILPELPENVEIIGFLSGSKLQDFYSRAKAFVFTSKVWEAMPLSILEAMSSGTAVIAHNVSSVTEILDHGNAGMIFSGADEGAEKITELLNNPSLRINFEKKGVERIRKYYSETIYSSSLCKILLQICHS